MKITAFAASNSEQSINLELVKFAGQHLSAHQIEFLDLNDFEMPIFSTKRNEQGIPALASQFNQIIEQSDALIIGLAEHNGTFTTAFKNIFDWASRQDMQVFKQKPMLLLATSPGERGGIMVLEAAKNIFPYFGGNIQSTFSFPSFFANFKDNNIVDPELNKDFLQQIERFNTALQQN